MADGLYTADGIESKTLYTIYIKAMEAYFKKLTPIERFVQKTTKEEVKVWQRSMEFAQEAEGVSSEFQRLVKPAARAIPLKDYDLGFGFTKKAIQDSEVNELDETHRESLRADQRLLEREFFRAMLTEGAAGYWHLAETVAPPMWKGNLFVAGHNHYKGAGAAVTTITLSAITEMKHNIVEHGYVGDLVLFISSSMVKDLEDLLLPTNAVTAITSTPLVSKLADVGVKDGLKIEGFTVVIDDWMPSDCMAGMCYGSVKPFLMREPVNAKGRGLKLYKGPYVDYPLAESYYERRFGISVGHRGAGAVTQFGVNEADYAPTLNY